MTHDSDSTPLPSVLRIYLRRRGTRPRRGHGWRLCGRSRSYDLAERALAAGVTYATVTLGHAGFVPGARRLVAEVSEIPPTPPPTSVALVSPVAVHEAFVHPSRDELGDATMLRLDGIAATLRGVPA